MTNLHKIKYFFLIIGLSAICYSGFAQTTNTGYFMKSQHSKSSFNPALRPEQGYIGFPLLSNIFLEARTNTFNLDHFIFPDSPKSKTFLHESISYSQFMNNIAENNFVNVDYNWTLLSTGFYAGKNFFSIELGIKAHSDFNVPDDIFSFSKKGLALGDQEAILYNFKNTQAKALGYGELALGFSREFLDKTLTLGVKGKYLLGLCDGTLNISQFRIEAGKDQWTIQTHATLDASAPGIVATYDEDGIFDGFDYDDTKISIAGYGYGFDLGASYKLSKLAESDGIISSILSKLTISAAVTDIGKITWNKKNNINLATKETSSVIAGNYNINFSDDSDNSLEDQFSAIGDTLKNAINLYENPNKQGNRSVSLRSKLNLGIEYQFNKKISAGILSSTYYNPSHTFSEYTLGSSLKPLSWIEFGLSYSFMFSKYDTFGFAVNLVPKAGMNIFLASDYIIPHVNSDYIPTTTQAINFQLGISFPIGSKH